MSPDEGRAPPDLLGSSPVQVVGSVDELLAGAIGRTPLVADDGKSGNWLERLTIDGRRYVAKHQSYDADWIMRVSGDRVHWALRAARAGLYDRVPACIDHAVVAMSLDGEGVDGELVVLMHDVGPYLVPEGAAPLPIDQHRGLIDHLAQMHAAYWGWTDDVGLQTMAQRMGLFAPATIAGERERTPVPVPIQVAHQGWQRLPEAAPALARVVFALHADPSPLVGALATTPHVFLHGDWKLGNIGVRPDGRTILLDWAYLGEGPPLWDLMWYLALNRDRLPESKEQTIGAYRTSLEGAGIDTDPWWDRQLALATVAIMVAFAWEKAVGDADELAWWDQRVAAAVRHTNLLG
jgi:hypothetical protein